MSGYNTGENQWKITNQQKGREKNIIQDQGVSELVHISGRNTRIIKVYTQGVERGTMWRNKTKGEET